MPRLNPAYVETLKQVVKSSPFPRHMAMVLDAIDIDRAVVGLDLGNCHLQPFGIVHGGVLATLIDTATFWAAFLKLPAEDGLVNVDLKLNYLRPVVEGRLLAKGTCLKSGKTISYAEARVWDASQRLLAHGTSTLMTLPGQGLDLGIAKYREDDGCGAG